MENPQHRSLLSKKVFRDRACPFLCILLIMVLFSSYANVKGQAPEGDEKWGMDAVQISNPENNSESPDIEIDQMGGMHFFWYQVGTSRDPSLLVYKYTKGEESNSIDIFAEGVSNPDAVIDDRGIIHLVFLKNDTLQYSTSKVGEALSARSWSNPVELESQRVLVPVIHFHDGTLHLLFVLMTAREDEDKLVDTFIYYTKSTDYGVSWAKPVIFAAPRHDVIVDRPQIHIGKDKVLHVVWSLIPQPAFYGGAGVYYVQSEDDGNTWSKPKRLDRIKLPGEELGAWYGNVITDRQNIIHVTWEAHSQAGRRYHQMSTDGGENWTQPVNILGTMVSQTGINPMVLDNQGHLYVFSAGAPNWDTRQSVYVSEWDGEGWTAPVMVNTDAEEPHWLKVAISNGNKLNIVWEARAQEPRGVWFASAEIDATHIDPQPYPEPTATPTQAIATVVQANAAITPTPTVKPTFPFDSQVAQTPSIMSVFFVPVLVTLAMIVGTIMIVVLRKR